MSENNKDNKDNVLDSFDIDDILNGTDEKEYLDEDDIMEDISMENEENLDAVDTVDSSEGTGPNFIFDDISLNDDVETESVERKSMLDMLEDDGMIIDEDEENEDTISFEGEEIEDEEIKNEDLDDIVSVEDEDDFEDDVDDIISVEDEDDFDNEVNDNDDFDLMNDMLSTVENEINQNPTDNTEDLYNNDNSFDNEDNPEDDFDYSITEIAKSNTGKNNQEKLIKIGVGVVAIIFIIVLSLLIKMLFFGNNSEENIPTVTPSPIITSTPIPTNKPIDDGKQDIVDDVIGDIDKPTIIPTPTEAPVEEDISVLKNYRGYVIDIKDDTIYVATLTYDRYQTLHNEFNNFYKYSEEEFLVWVDEEGKTYHKPNCNKFEKEGEQNPDENLLKKKEMLLSDAKANEFTPCECVDDTLLVKQDVDIKNFDYSLYPNLDGVIYVSLNISPYSNIFTDDELIIGDEVTVTYMQDNESLLNELIELKEVSSVNNNITDKPDEDTTPDVAEKDKNTNYWGDDWNDIVEGIKNRRDEEARLEQEMGGITNANGDLIITTTAKFESVSTPITIGKAPIVWFKINWKVNKEVTDVPSSEDVAVEILTPNSSLVTNENIDEYGSMWIDDATGLVNIVLKNTTSGTYEVVFTKEVGTYLGDVEIEAIPITGFLQLEKANAIYTNGRLEVIWQASGVADDHCIVEVYAVNGNKQTLLYSANSIDDGIHTVDMASVNVSKIAGNTYDIVIRVTDIDVSASKPYSIISTYLSDTVRIKNIEIPELRK